MHLGCLIFFIFIYIETQRDMCVCERDTKVDTMIQEWIRCPHYRHLKMLSLSRFTYMHALQKDKVDIPKRNQLNTIILFNNHTIDDCMLWPYCIYHSIEPTFSDTKSHKLLLATWYRILRCIQSDFGEAAHIYIFDVNWCPICMYVFILFFFPKIHQK